MLSWQFLVRDFLRDITIEALEKTMSKSTLSKDSRIIINAAKCLLCGDIIESKFRHDFQICTCGSLHVDGGKDYLKRGWEGSLTSYIEMSVYERAKE